MVPNDKRDLADDKSTIDFVAHEGSTNMIIFVAMAIGMFSMLMLFFEVEKYSLAWFVLTITYWFIFVIGIRSITLGALHGLILNYYYKYHIVPKIDEDLKDIIEKNFLLRKLYGKMLKDNDLSKSNFVTWIGITGAIVLGPLLWYVIAMDQV